MKTLLRAPLVHFLWLLLFPLVTVCGCAAPHASPARTSESYVVLLPQDGHSTGEVVVTTAKGTQVLNQPWQKTEIAGEQAPPAKPVPMTDPVLKAEVQAVLSTLPVQPAHFVLFFHYNSTDLMAKSRPLLPQIVKALRERPAAELVIVGHTDTIASESYNFDLGQRRAAHVLALLRKLGAAPARVQLATRGECDLMQQTPDQTGEPCNRRAEVTVR